MPRLLSLLLFVAVLLWPLPAHAQNPPPAGRPVATALRRDVAALMNCGPDRSASTPAAQRAADFLAQQLQQRTGQRVFRQRFTVVVPQVEFCSAATPDQPDLTFALAPLLPAGGQPSAIPGGQETAEVVYVGNGSLSELSGKPIRNNWIAMRLASGDAWQTAASLGARGILFLASPRDSIRDFLDKNTVVPIDVPRFYSDDPDLADLLESGTLRSLTLAVRVRWTSATAENLFCLIPGRQQSRSLPQAAAGWTDQIVLLQAPYDATSQVLGRSPGAQHALDAAAVLDLAERAASQPDHCSLLVALTSGDEWLFRGTRAMLDMLRPDQAAADAVKSLEGEMATGQQALADAQELLDRLRAVAAGDLSTLSARGVGLTIRDQLDRRSAQVEQALESLRLADPSSVSSSAERLASLNMRKRQLLDAATAAVRQTGFDQPHVRRLLQDAAAELLVPWTREVERRRQALVALRFDRDLRRALGPRPLMIHLGVDLTAGGSRLGLFARSSYAAQGELAGRMSPFARSFDRYLVQARQVDPSALAAFDDRSTQSTYSLESFFPVRRAFSTDLSLACGLPASTFATVADAGSRLDTPGDTAEALDWNRLQPQLAALYRLLLGTPGSPGALTDPRFNARTTSSVDVGRQIFTLYERSFGETIPRLGAADHLVGFEQTRTRDGAPFLPIAGLRPIAWQLTPVTGEVAFSTLPAGAPFRVQAFRFDADGLADRALAQPLDLEIDANRPQRGIVFDSRRLDLFGLFDPRYLSYLDRLELLDARRQDKVQTASYIAQNGIAAVFMPPDIRWQLLVSKGDVSNRMVLINADPEHPAGVGFSTVDRAEIGPLAWRNARDLYCLDDKRKRDLERFGITNEVITELHGGTPSGPGRPLSARDHLQAAQAAADARDYAALLAHANAAWSLEIAVYNNLLTTSNGIIRGVIFLLLGLIPFSYFLERLLIGSTSVYRQIGGFALIFALMTAALGFHPAFRISAAPVMILLAFLILILSSTVVWILMGKFEEEIARLRGAAVASHTANLRRAAVLGAAVRLGLSNMRRRGTRTALTLVTLILLTFTLLCFTSVREAVRLTPRLIADAPSSPPGLLLRQFAWRPLPPPTLQYAAQLAGPGGLVAPRYWYASDRPDLPWLLPVTPAGRPAQAFIASALVGLDPDEAAFHDQIAQYLPGFQQLIDGRDVCFLPDEVAVTGLRIGDSVDILGRRLAIAGFFDNAAIARFRQITGDPMTPLDPASSGTPSAGVPSNKPENDTLRPEQSYRFLSPRSVVFLPAAVARDLGATLTSVMIRPADPSHVPSLAEGLARRSAFTLYAVDASRPDAPSIVRSYNAAASSSAQDLDRVLVPIVIAGIIVLNTMLGAVSERTREIHVYTSLGLAPTHVGTLFLAEAAALGTLGVVFGYVFGQGLATLLSHFRLMQGVDLNYSSMSAILVMGLVLALVMLSALWPARMASRLAAPSLQRDWKLPAPVGDLLTVDLPFTVNQTAARGVCAFLEEYFTSVSQTGAARFTADDLRAFVSPAAAYPDSVRGLTCRVWLAPYDLGVIQTFWLAIHPTDDPSVYEVQITLVREAGNPSTWRRLNRPFLVEVRKQFLLWRAVKPELMQEYVAKSQSMFDQAETLRPPAPL